MPSIKAWVEAWEEVKRIVAQYGDLPILDPGGGPINRSHAVVWKKDALSGEGMGFNINIYPEGSGYMKPVIHHSVEVKE